MATKRNGETYLGPELHVPLSADGQVTAYVWPVRILNIRGRGVGGPTVGIDVGNEEVVRFDCHDTQGHWHGGGYDRLGSPGNSQRPFPSELAGVGQQLAWSFQQIQDRARELLEEAEYSPAAGTLDPALVQQGIDAIRTHLSQQGDLRSKAVADNLIDV